MKEILKSNKLFKYTAILGALVLPACATTEGPGVLARRDQCIETEAKYSLETGQDLDIAVSDISFNASGTISDNIHAKVKGPGIIKFVLGIKERNIIKLDGSTYNEDIEITAINQPISGQIIEDEIVMDFTVRKNNSMTELDLVWDCKQE